MTFGETIRQARIAQQRSLRGVARLIGVSPSYLSDLELGQRPAPLTPHVLALAEVLNLDATALQTLAAESRPVVRVDTMRYGPGAKRAMLLAFLRWWDSGTLNEGTAERLLAAFKGE